MLITINWNKNYFNDFNGEQQKNENLKKQKSKKKEKYFTEKCFLNSPKLIL